MTADQTSQQCTGPGGRSGPDENRNGGSGSGGGDNKGTNTNELGIMYYYC